jgi:Flp pilus assembly protein TadD
LADNQEVYQHELDSGNNFLLQQDWTNAVSAYVRAIKELPQDWEAYLGLGNALLGVHRDHDALRVFDHGRRIAPDNPALGERAAYALERLGRIREATQVYIQVADIYHIEKHDLERAIVNWERATQLMPGLVAIHVKLAKAHEEIAQKPFGSL